MLHRRPVVQWYLGRRREPPLVSQRARSLTRSAPTVVVRQETRSIASGRVVAAECEDGLQVCGRRLLRMHPESPFLLSHQSTLWRRELLLECMRDGENAFEVRGGARAAHTSPSIDATSWCRWKLALTHRLS